MKITSKTRRYHDYKLQINPNHSKQEAKSQTIKDILDILKDNRDKLFLDRDFDKVIKQIKELD